MTFIRDKVNKVVKSGTKAVSLSTVWTTAVVAAEVMPAVVRNRRLPIALYCESDLNPLSGFPRAWFSLFSNRIHYFYQEAYMLFFFV